MENFTNQESVPHFFSGTEIPTEAGQPPSLQNANKTVALHLIRTDEMPACSFWIGLFQKGKLSPKELFDCNGLNDLLEKAATKGIGESGPIMLSDSVAAPARFVYLLPEPGHDHSRRSQWTSSLCETVRAWSPQKIGIYLAPALVSQRLAHELLREILQDCIKETPTTDYFLQSTTHGINAILNTAVLIKEELEQDKFNIYIFH